MYSFQKLTQFSKGNNALEAAASNTDGFLCRDICVSSTHLSIAIWSKERLSPTLQTSVAESIPFQNKHNSHWKAMC
jgi:hypothetical protein